MSKKLNVSVSFIRKDNGWWESDNNYYWFESAFDYEDKALAENIVINNPDDWCYSMAVASYYDMLDEYHEYEEVLFKAIIASSITVRDYETYTIIKKSRYTFLIKYYTEYDEDEDEGKDIIYIDDKPYVDTNYREAYWFTDLRFTPNGTTEPKEEECRIWEAYEKYDEEYFEEY